MKKIIEKGDIVKKENRRVTMEGGNVENRLDEIIREIGKIKEDMATKKDIDELKMATKKDIDELKMATKKDIDELKNRIDELEDNFQRENRRLRDRISELEDNYESIARGAKVAQRLGPIVYPPMTFAEDSTFCDEYKIATYREKTGL